MDEVVLLLRGRRRKSISSEFGTIQPRQASQAIRIAKPN
jgi:hypothetical protein